MRKILIGTGYYSAAETAYDKICFFHNVWLPNSQHLGKTVIIENGAPTSAFGPHRRAFERVSIENNLGHSGNSTIHGNRLMGWSMSWIIPALIAYSENCDFIYKEQDCLAFGDWVSAIRHGDICYGKNDVMPCEQSLFYLRRDVIPDFIAAYMSIPEQDNIIVTEDKMVRAAKSFDVHVTDMPFGRNRPLTIYKDRPWYAQRISAEELTQIKEAGLI